MKRFANLVLKLSESPDQKWTRVPHRRVHLHMFVRKHLKQAIKSCEHHTTSFRISSQWNLSQLHRVSEQPTSFAKLPVAEPKNSSRQPKIERTTEPAFVYQFVATQRPRRQHGTTRLQNLLRPSTTPSPPRALVNCVKENQKI